MEEKHVWRVCFVLFLMAGIVWGQLTEEDKTTLTQTLKQVIGNMNNGNTLTESDKDEIAEQTYYIMQAKIDLNPCQQAYEKCISNMYR